MLLRDFFNNCKLRQENHFKRNMWPGKLKLMLSFTNSHGLTVLTQKFLKDALLAPPILLELDKQLLSNMNHNIQPNIYYLVNNSIVSTWNSATTRSCVIEEYSWFPQYGQRI